MVAVQDKILKASKAMPDNLVWDGKVDTWSSFFDLFTEWVEIRLGEEAAHALAGVQKDEHGDTSHTGVRTAVCPRCRCEHLRSN